MSCPALAKTLAHLDLNQNKPRAHYSDICLRSAFQPVISLPHQRTVGYEVLIRGQSASGEPIPAPELFSLAKTQADMVFFDRLCRALHIKSFLREADQQSWLFLNVNPEVMVHGRHYGRFFSELLSETQIKPERIVIEILESPLLNEEKLVRAVDFYRDLGCLVAIDDFGAGYSNFQRIWRLKPNIVKLDQSIIRQASNDKVALRMLPNIVATLHEAGSLVLMEGIETQQEAVIALEANLDLVQGYYFSRPSFELEAVDVVEPLVAQLYDGYQLGLWRCQTHSQYADHIQAIHHALPELQAALIDLSLQGSIRQLMDLPGADRCYLLGEDGRQIGQSFIVSRSSHCEHYKPLQDTDKANWVRRTYWQKAVQNLCQIQITRPYLSVATGHLCVTLSMAYRNNNTTRVFCLDLDYDTM